MEKQKLKEILDSIISPRDHRLVIRDTPHADINPKKWYIVDLRRPHKPRYIRKTFESRELAMAVFEEHYGLGIGGFFPAKGSELIQFKIPARKWHSFAKYPYLPSYTKQQKHSLRIKERRKQRKEKVKDKSWNPKYWVYPEDIKAPYQKHLYRVRKRKERIRRIARES